MKTPHPNVPYTPKEPRHRGGGSPRRPNKECEGLLGSVLPLLGAYPAPEPRPVFGAEDYAPAADNSPKSSKLAIVGF